MGKLSISFLCCMLIFFVLSNSYAATWDVIFQVDVENQTGNNYLLGVEFDGINYWITGSGHGGDNQLYKLNEAGDLLDTYSQGTSSYWGWRDMAFDGTYLYASDSEFIEQINPATGTATGLTINGPENPNRGLAYDPDTDHFWTANFGGDIYEFDRDGNVINQYSNGKSVYGLAWDNCSEDGPWLWVWSQDGVGVLLSQFNPRSGIYTAVTFEGIDPPGGVAGGATLRSDGTFVAIHQADPDTMVGYELTIPCSPQPIPTLSEWGMIAFSLLLGCFAIWYMRKKSYRGQMA